MDHMNLNDELRKQLLESAAWGKIGIELNESEAVEEEAVIEEESTEDFEEGEEYLEEEEAVHVCPLCISQLDEAIDEERILEHLDVVMGLVDRLSQLNEGDEDVEEAIDEALADLLFGELEEEAEEE